MNGTTKIARKPGSKAGGVRPSRALQCPIIERLTIIRPAGKRGLLRPRRARCVRARGSIALEVVVPSRPRKVHLQFGLGPSARIQTARRAFTLLEVLLALAIAAIVLAALNTVFFSAMRMRATTTAMVQSVLPSDRAVSVMKADLAGIVPVGVMAGPMGSDIAGVGMTQPAALEIFTSSGILSADAPWGPIQKIDYSLQDPTNRMTSSGRDLVRGVTRNLLAVTPPAPDQQVLIGDVQSLKFSYYDGTNWNESWSAVLSNTPVAIRVSIDFTPSRTDLPTSPPIQFVVPIYAQARTNQSQTLD
jgi:type II secretion system protein J